jgi:hypothetical protein
VNISRKGVDRLDDYIRKVFISLIADAYNDFENQKQKDFMSSKLMVNPLTKEAMQYICRFVNTSIIIKPEELINILKKYESKSTEHLRSAKERRNIERVAKLNLD